MVRCNRTYYLLLKLQAKIKKKNFKVVFPSQIPANYANSAQFAPTVRKIRTFYIMFQAPAPAENPAKFQRITQIPRGSPTQSANYAKFAPFANTTPYVSDAWPVAENSLKFQRIKRNSLNSPTYPANSAHFAVN